MSGLHEGAELVHEQDDYDRECRRCGPLGAVLLTAIHRRKCGYTSGRLACYRCGYLVDYIYRQNKPGQEYKEGPSWP